MIVDVAERSYGTGSLFVRADAAGRESWYGQWRAGDAVLKRRLGDTRRPGERRGMTKAQAEAELRPRIEASVRPPRRRSGPRSQRRAAATSTTSPASAASARR